VKDVSVIQVDGIMWSEKYGKECWDYLRIKNKVLKKHSVLVEKSGNGVFIKYEKKNGKTENKKNLPSKSLNDGFFFWYD
jgi:hypothetical protein